MGSRRQRRAGPSAHVSAGAQREPERPNHSLPGRQLQAACCRDRQQGLQFSASCSHLASSFPSKFPSTGGEEGNAVMNNWHCGAPSGPPRGVTLGCSFQAMGHSPHSCDKKRSTRPSESNRALSLSDVPSSHCSIFPSNHACHVFIFMGRLRCLLPFIFLILSLKKKKCFYITK